MNLQLLRHTILKPTRSRVAGLALVLSVFGIAQAQVATRVQLSSAASDHGTTYTASVSDIAGNPATDGVVSLENAKGASFGSAMVKDGVAQLTVDQQISGSVYAVYSGSKDFRASMVQTQATGDTTGTEPDFTITANPTSLSLNPGQYGTIVLTITPLNGFSDMVTLSCGTIPAASNCTFSPTTLTPLTANPVTSSLQITTQGPSGAMLVYPGHHSETALAIVLPGLLALVGLGAVRKRSGLSALSMIGLAALLAASALGMSACAQRYDYLHHPPESNPGIAAGTYTIPIAAYSNNGSAVTSHTLNVTLTVK